MKLKKALIITTAAVLVLMTGRALGFVAGGRRQDNPAPNRHAISPVMVLVSLEG